MGMPGKQSIKPAGLGRKRPLLIVPIGKLHLDPENPRLPEEIQGRPEAEILKYLFDHFDLEEISAPMGQNGYFDEEPLVAIPISLPKGLIPKQGQQPLPEYLKFIQTADLTVIEGNRRLATALILREEKLRQEFHVRSWPEISRLVREDLDELPVIIYPTRDEVLPYLGVRHITGNKKWDSYAKARYIVAMLDGGYDVEAVEREIGDRSQAVLKNAVAYKVLQQAKEEFDFDLGPAKDDFSFMLLAIGQRNVKGFLGWTKKTEGKEALKILPLDQIPLDEPIPASHLANLRDFLSWIYGEGKKLPVIKESRDITNFLSHVVASPKAVEYLRKTRDLREAYELSDGEEAMVRKFLAMANSKLEKVLGVIHRHKSATDVVSEAEKCADTANRVLKTVRE